MTLSRCETFSACCNLFIVVHMPFSCAVFPQILKNQVSVLLLFLTLIPAAPFLSLPLSDIPDNCACSLNLLIAWSCSWLPDPHHYDNWRKRSGGLEKEKERNDLLQNTLQTQGGRQNGGWCFSRAAKCSSSKSDVDQNRHVSATFAVV
jgi:hypothetical protein